MLESISELPLGDLRESESDVLFAEKHNDTCSRCCELIAEFEMPLCLWVQDNPDLMYRFCQRCAFDPDSDRCKKCGCTQNQACDDGCSWVKPGLCSSCVEVP